MSPFDELEIEPTEEKRAIKRAYAKKLKRTRPEDDADAFRVLRAAYEAALEYAEHPEYYAVWDDDSEPEDDGFELALVRDEAVEDGGRPAAEDVSEAVDEQVAEAVDERVAEAVDEDASEAVDEEGAETVDEHVHQERSFEALVDEILEAEDPAAMLETELVEIIDLQSRADLEDALIYRLGEDDVERLDLRMLAAFGARFGWSTRRPDWHEQALFERAGWAEGALAARAYLESVDDQTIDAPRFARRAAAILLDRAPFSKRSKPALSKLESQLAIDYGPLWDRFVPGAFYADTTLIKKKEGNNFGCALWFLAYAGFKFVQHAETETIFIAGAVLIVVALGYAIWKFTDVLGASGA